MEDLNASLPEPASGLRPAGDDPARKMRLVIIESPYAGDIEANVAYARACMRDSLNRGEAPIASHLLYTQPGVLRDEVQEERRWGIAAGLAWRKAADVAVFYTDRNWSGGMIEARRVYTEETFPWEERRLYGPRDSDTHPTGGDGLPAPFMGSAGRDGIAQTSEVNND